MRCLSKIRSLDLYSAERLFKFQVSECRCFSLSSLHPSAKIPEKPQTDARGIDPLFREIVEIIGTDNLRPRESPIGVPVSQETRVIAAGVREELPLGIGCVRQFADESVGLDYEKTLIPKDTRLATPDVNDVSPIVHKVTEIVRAENDVIPMEERLENLGIQFNSNVVENVLKRCFKVRNLAFRFFKWVQLRAGFHHTTGTYNTMIYIAGEAKEFDLVEKLVEEMENNSCPKDMKTWTILISHYGKAKLIGKALLVFEKMRKSDCTPDRTAFKIIIQSLCTARKAEIALEFYREMVLKDMVVDINLYKLLLNCLSRSGDFSAVRMVGEDMIKVSQIPENIVYSCLLKSFCISGSIGEALELIRELRNKMITLDSGSLEILVKGLCRADRIGDALEIVDIMRNNHILDGKVYGIIINGYLKRSEISKALELFSCIKESGHLPTASTYTELMQHLFWSNEYQRACELYEDMLVNRVEPDTVATMALVAGLIRHNHVSEAWEIFRNMKEKGIMVTQKSYSVFIRELCRASKTNEALELLSEMWNSKINIGDGIFQLVISSLDKKGELEKAEKVKGMSRATKLCTQQDESIGLPATHQSLCGGSDMVFNAYEPQQLGQSVNSNQLQLCRTNVHLVQSLPEVYNNHDLQEVCNILSSSMKWCLMQEALEKCKIKFTPEHVLEVLHKCQKHGYAALHFFSWVGQQPGYRHNTETYNMGIKIAGCAKDFKHMRNLYHEMRRRGCLITSDTWTIMIMQYGRAGLTKIALKKFQEMKFDECKATRSMYKYLIIALCGRKGRKVDEAIKMFNEMIYTGFMPDKELIEIYLHCLCDEGKLSDARRCVESLCKGGFTIPLGYSLLIRALCRAGRLDKALALAEEMGEEWPNLDQYIYGSLVHGMLRERRLNEALDKVETMKQMGVYPTVHVYTSLITHFFKDKQVGKALEMFKKMMEQGCEPTIVTYSAFIRGYMNMGMVVDAWDLFHRISLKGPFPDFKAYSMFITCLCKMGRSEEALCLIHEMLDDGIFPSAVNFRTVFYGLNREGKQDLAHTVLQKKWALISNRKFLK